MKSRNIINKVSLLKKIILLFIGTILVPFVIQTIALYYQTQKNLENDLSERMEIVLLEKAEKLEAYLSGAISLSRTYSKQEAIYRFLDEDYQSEMEYLEVYQEEIRPVIERNMPFYLQIKETMFYTDNPYIFNGAYVKQLSTADMDREIFLQNVFGQAVVETSYEADHTEGLLVLTHNTEQSRKLSVNPDRTMSLFYPLDYYTQYGDYQKIVRFDMNLPYIKKDIIEEKGIFDNLILTDLDGKVIFAADSYRDWGEYVYFDLEKEKGNALTVMRKLDGFPFVLYGIYEVDGLRGEMEAQVRNNMMISGLVFCIAGTFIFVIMGNLSARIKRVVEQSQKVSAGQFVLNEYDSSGKDEITILERSMNEMTKRLDTLIQKEYRNEIARAELEQQITKSKLLALQSQTNPHFMFNALESIRLRAVSKGETETAQMIKYMSKMFRQLITWDNNIITLKEEIDFMDEFLHIQEYRFGDEFYYQIDVEEEVKLCLIPKMMVQQLVENACIHGVGAISNERRVYVKIYREKEELVIIVSDNGGGIEESRLEELRRMMKEKTDLGACVGLYNIYHRLLLYYGEDCSFDIESTLHKGTICTIKLPIHFEKWGNENV